MPGTLSQVEPMDSRLGNSQWDPSPKCALQNSKQKKESQIGRDPTQE
jgi:hypothetical protein